MKLLFWLPIWALLMSVDQPLVRAEGAEEEAKRPLVKPKLSLCRDRPAHLRFGSHRYLLSWMLTPEQHASSTYGGQVDWLTARNFCRERCMDTVAIETQAEWKILVKAIDETLANNSRSVVTTEDSSPAIWTSGRLCDFEGCEKAEYLKPLLENGWFWSSNQAKMSATTCVNRQGNCFHAWSHTGKLHLAQPDNREPREEGVSGYEACLAILVNAYQDGIRWHDRACYHETYFICEDSDSLIKFMRRVYKAAANIPD